MAKCAVLITIVTLIAFAMAEPEPEAKPGVLAAPLVAPPLLAPAVVTAQSSQYISRNYNAPLIATGPLLAAPAVVNAAASYVAAPAPVAYRAPFIRAANPYYAAPYVAGGYYGAYNAPLIY